MKDFSDHPCFDFEARERAGRVHLPVAPKCNIQCRFCNRLYDCPNEGRPGVTSLVLPSHRVSDYMERVIELDPRIRVVGIAGPGEPLANPEATFEALQVVKRHHPELMLCLSTNGLALPQHVRAIAEVGVSHVTVTVNAVDATLGARFYAWVRDGKRILRGEQAAACLLERQLRGIEMLKELDVTVKVNTIVVPGVNESHVPDVARTVAALGCDLQNCMPLYPASGSDWEAMQEPSAELLARIRSAASVVLQQMSHCGRCRADAIGLVEGPHKPASVTDLADLLVARPTAERPFVAVATMEGVLVNKHLGESQDLAIFGRQNGELQLIETRQTPKPGGGARRWRALAATLRDCCFLLVGGAGQSPRKVLGEQGIEVVAMEGVIEPALKQIFAGKRLRAHPPMRERCGDGCGGTGTGCA